MNDGSYVLEWAHQNSHKLTWIADKIGYARSTLSQALHTNRISPRLADALFEHFGLCVVPTGKSAEAKTRGKVRRTALGQQSAAKRRPGRPPGLGGQPGTSKLDTHQPDIEYLLANGATQRYIASKYQITESTLSTWMKKRGLKRTPRV